MSIFMISLWCCFSMSAVWAQTVEPESQSASVTIETHWDSMWGMKYLQNGEELKGASLRLLLQSEDDPAINTLMDRSADDEALGTVGLGASVVASLVCLVLPSTQIHLGSLNIAAPYLPVQIPALTMGVVAAFFTNAAGAARFEAVERYNRTVSKKADVTWDFSVSPDRLAFGLKCAL